MRLHGLIAAALAAMAWTAAAQAEPATAKVVLHAPLRILDPVLTNAYITRNHGYLIYDTLFAIDTQGRPQPQMVDRWTVSDLSLIHI